MKYNVTEIIDFNTITVFQHFTSITFIITVTLEIFYGIIVYLSTTKSMQFFRILTFIYIFECIFAEFVMFCWKPFRLFPYTILYPTGILAPMSSLLSASFTAFFPFGHACFIDTLTIIVVERHFRILGDATKIKKSRFWVYFFLALTNILTGIPFFTFFIQNLDDSKVPTLLKSEVENIEQILSLQPSLFLTDTETYSTTIWIIFFSGLIYGFYRFLLVSFVLKENYKFVTNKNSNISEKTRKQFSLMFQSTMTQFLTTIFCALFMCIWFITFVIRENSVGIKVVYYLSLGVILCYPILDVIIVIAVVKGYRNTLKKIIYATKGKADRKISGFGFQNVSINNNRSHNNITVVAASRKISVY